MKKVKLVLSGLLFSSLFLFSCGGDKSYISDAEMNAKYACYMKELGKTDLSIYIDEERSLIAKKIPSDYKRIADSLFSKHQEAGTDVEYTNEMLRLDKEGNINCDFHDYIKSFLSSKGESIVAEKLNQVKLVTDNSVDLSFFSGVYEADSEECLMKLTLSGSELSYEIITNYLCDGKTFGSTYNVIKVEESKIYCNEDVYLITDAGPDGDRYLELYEGVDVIYFSEISNDDFDIEFDVNNLLGKYKGDFGGKTITIVLEKLNKTDNTILGFNKVGENKRPLKGTFEKADDGYSYVLELSEPGDDKWDGKFFIMASENELSGTWTSNNGKSEKEFKLQKD
jgi:hypothetical protein